MLFAINVLFRFGAGLVADAGESFSDPSRLLFDHFFNSTKRDPLGNADHHSPPRSDGDRGRKAPAPVSDDFVIKIDHCLRLYTVGV